MGQDINALLHKTTIDKVIAAVKGELKDDILPPQFFRPTIKVVGHESTLLSQYQTRTVARLVAYGAPSVKVSTLHISKIPVTLLHSFESFSHEPALLMKLLSKNDEEQQMGSEIVGMKVGDAVRRQRNLRRAAWFSTLANGKIWIDADGNLLPSEVGAFITVDFGIPAGNKDQLDWDGNGDIIDASWATAATDIPTQIAAIKKASVAMTGYQIKTAYYGENIPSYLAGNDLMKEFLVNSEKAANSMLAGQIPNGFLKLNWIPASEAMYQTKDGDAHFWFSGDAVVFTPDVSDIGWWAMILGSYPVPVSVGSVSGDALAALQGGLRNTYGQFSYCIISPDPVSLSQYWGDTFLSCISVPRAVFQANVVV